MTHDIQTHCGFSGTFNTAFAMSPVIPHVANSDISTTIKGTLPTFRNPNMSPKEKLCPPASTATSASASISASTSTSASISISASISTSASISISISASISTSASISISASTSASASASPKSIAPIARRKSANMNTIANGAVNQTLYETKRYVRNSCMASLSNLGAVQ